MGARDCRPSATGMRRPTGTPVPYRHRTTRQAIPQHVPVATLFIFAPAFEQHANTVSVVQLTSGRLARFAIARNDLWILPRSRPKCLCHHICVRGGWHMLLPSFILPNTSYQINVGDDPFQTTTGENSCGRRFRSDYRGRHHIYPQHERRSPGDPRYHVSVRVDPCTWWHLSLIWQQQMLSSV